MHAVVVYESSFGNTRQIAEAICRGLSRHVRADLVEVPGGLIDAREADLLVIGGPTHAFGMSRPGTRAGARQQGAQGASSSGIREWIMACPVLPPRAAVFDTKVRRVRWLPGAAKDAAARLRRRKVALMAGPRSFLVAGVSGPLRAGELERAELWGSQLGALLTAGAWVAAG